MDQILKEASETGNVCALYELIERDGNVLRRFDQVESINNPLHTAAENGCIEFAMEIMSLKPSLARKLNHQGLSPLHLAVEKGQVKTALCLMEIDKDLVRVRGKNGETPLHYLSKIENQHCLLDRFVDGCPEGTRDVTSQNRTALHIAVENNRLDVLKVLIRSIRNKEYYEQVVNLQDEDGNTALHIAAKINQTEMLKLLLKCKANKQVSNHDKKMALDLAHEIESIRILRDCFSPKLMKSLHELKKKMNKKVTKASSLVFHGMDTISDDDRSALLVVLGLLLTITYTAALSPPGGLWQGDSYSNSTSVRRPGTTVMDETQYLYFYIPTYVAFVVTFFLTLALLKPYPSGFRTALQVLLAFLAVCFDQSVSYISPTILAQWTIRVFSVIVFVLMVVMCIAYQVSKVSVSIVGCFIIPIYGVALPSGVVIGISPVQVLLLIIFKYDNLVEGTILAVCYSFFLAISVPYWLGGGFISSVLSGVCFMECWVLLHAALLLIKRFIKGW